MMLRERNVYTSNVKLFSVKCYSQFFKIILCLRQSIQWNLSFLIRTQHVWQNNHMEQTTLLRRQVVWEKYSSRKLSLNQKKACLREKNWFSFRCSFKLSVKRISSKGRKSDIRTVSVMERMKISDHWLIELSTLVFAIN